MKIIKLVTPIAIAMLLLAISCRESTETPVISPPIPAETLVPAPTSEPIPTPTPTPTPTPEAESAQTPAPTSAEAEELWWKWTGFTGPVHSPEADIPIIDAHSQVDQYVELERVIELMDQAGVSVTILASRASNMVQMEELLVSFASVYPGKIIPAVRTKGYMQVLGDNYAQFLKHQVTTHQYGAMAEVLIYHAEKGDRASLVVMQPDDEIVQAALNCAVEKKWPFISHIEFVDAGSQRDEFMTKFEALLLQYPNHPFVLIHMGQLDCAEVRQLIDSHDNIHFIASKSNPISANKAWPELHPTSMFDDDRLAEDWKQLMTEHPDRFILGFDNTWVEDWGQYYLDQVALWREAIKELPVEVAHAFAHGNAERLWHLQLTE